MGPVVLEGLVNFRDLGGVPVEGGAIRPGVLYRSDSLSYATDADAVHLRDGLGLRTIVDLRDPAEIEEFGRGPLAGSPIAYLAVPCGDVVTADTRHAHYAAMVEHYGPAFADLIRALVAPGALPALVHCHVGCDRTGTVTALLLGLVGASDEEICADYARSTRASEVVRERSDARRRHLGLPTMDRAYYDTWEPRPEIMADALALIHARWGGWTGWADAHGVHAGDRAALRHALVA